MNDSLDGKQMTAQLRTAWLGRTVRYFADTNSTNDQLKAALAAGERLPDGTVFLANYQSAGRGRLQRRWVAPAGSSLLFSVLLRPGWPAIQAGWLTMIASLAAAAAIEQTAPLPVGVKWPNDVMVRQHDEWRKVGGILLDGDLDEDGRLRSVIVGMGINVNVPAADLPATHTPATSLLAAGGRPVSRLALLADLLTQLEQGFETAAAGESPQPAWDQRLILRDQPVTITHLADGQTLHGIALGVNEWGHLLVRDAAGRQHTIAAGDVTLRRS